MSGQKRQPEYPELPRHKGSYLLLLELAEPQTVAVGRLGPLDFSAGLYLYAGSANGPGGLAARLRHHLKPSKRCHWHIDYLRLKAPVAAVWAGWGPAARCPSECRLIARLNRHASLYSPYKGFGSSDCTCYSHLLYWPLPASDTPLWATSRKEAIACLQDALIPLTRLL